jgi:hypothetical protein
VRQLLVVHPNEVRGGWRMVVQAKRTDKDKPTGTARAPAPRQQALSETWSYIVPASVSSPAHRRRAAPVRRLAPPVPHADGAEAVARAVAAELAVPCRSRPADVDGPARGAGQRRRFVLLALSLAPAIYATYVMSGLLPQEASSIAGEGAARVFAILSCWLAAGFWTAMMGFVVLLRGGDRHLISRSAVRRGALPRGAHRDRHADLQRGRARVFAGLRATIRVGRPQRQGSRISTSSCCQRQQRPRRLRGRTRRLARAARDGSAASDARSSTAGARNAGSSARAATSTTSAGAGAAQYRYMVVLDADSVMSGDCLATLVRLMEANPDAGIIQTAPRAVGRDTLHARIQQFANRVYGRCSPPACTSGSSASRTTGGTTRSSASSPS